MGVIIAAAVAATVIAFVVFVEGRRGCLDFSHRLVRMWKVGSILLKAMSCLGPAASCWAVEAHSRQSVSTAA